MTEKRCENCRHEQNKKCSLLKVDSCGKLWRVITTAAPDMPHFDPGPLFCCKFHEEKKNMWSVELRNQVCVLVRTIPGSVREWQIVKTSNFKELCKLCDDLNKKEVCDVPFPTDLDRTILLLLQGRFGDAFKLFESYKKGDCGD